MHQKVLSASVRAFVNSPTEFGLWSIEMMARVVPWWYKGPSSFNNDLGFMERAEDFAVKQFISHPPMKTLAISVFPK